MPENATELATERLSAYVPKSMVQAVNAELKRGESLSALMRELLESWLESRTGAPKQ